MTEKEKLNFLIERMKLIAHPRVPNGRGMARAALLELGIKPPGKGKGPWAAKRSETVLEARQEMHDLLLGMKITKG